MGNKIITRRVKAGMFTWADLAADDVVYVTGLDAFYSNVETFTTNFGTFEKGKILRKNSRNSIISALVEQHVTNRTYLDWRVSKTPDEIYKFLCEIDGVGHKSAVLFTVAIKGQLPDLKYIVADQIHASMFEAPALPELAKVRAKYASEYDTKMKRAFVPYCAGEMYDALIAACNLKNPPSKDDVVDGVILSGESTWTSDDGKWMMSKRIHDTEENLVTLANTKCASSPEVSVGEVEGLGEDQRLAVAGITQGNRLVLLNGMPGSGKSHVICSLYKMYGKGSVLITSWTNKACQVLNQRIPSYSIGKVEGIRSLLSVYYTAQNNEGYALAMKSVKLLVCDEASMNGSLSTWYLLQILECCAPDCRLLLVGDQNQLPPVEEYGRPFSQLCIAQQVLGIRVCSLVEFRRSNADGIFNAFAAMSVPGVHNVQYTHGQVEIIKARTPALAVEKTASAFINTAGDSKSVAVIAGTNALCDEVNMMIARTLFGDRLTFQKHSGEPQARHIVPDLPGMRIVCVNNLKNKRGQLRMAKNVFADVIVNTPEFVRISNRVTGETLDVSHEELVENFQVGYACTVHKYQGSEEDVIYYIFDSDSNMHGDFFETMKELKYVALSRAKKCLRIVAVCREIEHDYLAATILPIKTVASKDAIMYI